MSDPPVSIVADLDLIPPLIRLLYDLRAELPMFTVYDRPEDFPDHIVARLWTSLPEPRPTTFLLRASTIGPVRDFLAALGLTHLSRSPEDNPAVLETWL